MDTEVDNSKFKSYVGQGQIETLRDATRCWSLEVQTKKPVCKCHRGRWMLNPKLSATLLGEKMHPSELEVNCRGGHNKYSGSHLPVCLTSAEAYLTKKCFTFRRWQRLKWIMLTKRLISCLHSLSIWPDINQFLTWRRIFDVGRNLTGSKFQQKNF